MLGAASVSRIAPKALAALILVLVAPRSRTAMAFIGSTSLRRARIPVAARGIIGGTRPSADDMRPPMRVPVRRFRSLPGRRERWPDRHGPTPAGPAAPHRTRPRARCRHRDAGGY